MMGSFSKRLFNMYEVQKAAGKVRRGQETSVFVPAPSAHLQGEARSCLELAPQALTVGDALGALWLPGVFRSPADQGGSPGSWRKGFLLLQARSGASHLVSAHQVQFLKS